MPQFFRLILTLACLWFLLSGYFKAQFLILGVICVALVVVLAYRMRLIEHRGQLIYFSFSRILVYWSWLLWQIVLSNIDVTRRVWGRELNIEPALRVVSASPDTEMGRVIYANSITLTPGTTAINFTPEDHILVHALHEDSLAELEAGEMASRIRAFESHLRKKSGSY